MKGLQSGGLSRFSQLPHFLLGALQLQVSKMLSIDIFVVSKLPSFLVCPHLVHSAATLQHTSVGLVAMI